MKLKGSIYKTVGTLLFYLEQKAREMERSIRKDRRELNVKDIEINNLPEGIEKDQAQARFDELSYRVTEKTNTYNEFIRVNKLGNGTSRLKVAGYNKKHTFNDDDLIDSAKVILNKNASNKAKKIALELDNKKQMKLIGELVSDYTTFSSQMTDIITTSSLKKPAKYNRKTGICYLRPDATIKNKIHERIHSCTDFSGYTEESALINGKLNEGAIEYLTQEICKEHGIAFRGTYGSYVASLRKIAKIIDIPDMDLARLIANEKYVDRYRTLETLVNLSNVTDKERITLNECLTNLKGKHTYN